MDIFNTQASNGEGPLGLPSGLEDVAHGAVAPVAPVASATPAATPAAAPQNAPRAADPHERMIAEAVAYMAANYWTQGKMTGELLANWQRMYAGLLAGATSALEVSRAARLADYAFTVALSRQNRKAST